MKLFSIVRQFQLVQDEEHQSHQHSDYTCEYHSRKLDASELYGYAGKPSHKNNGGHCHVSGFPVIYLCLYKDADTGCTDHSVQEEGNTTDNRPGIVLIRVVIFPINEHIIDSTAAPPMT